MKKVIIVATVSLVVFLYCTRNNLLHDPSAEPELMNRFIIQSALKDARVEFNVTGKIEQIVLDAYGTELKFEVDGKTLNAISAGEDKIFKTEDDQIGEITI